MNREVDRAYMPVEQKTFLLRMSKDLWRMAKEQAEQKNITLHNYILGAIAEKVQKFKSKGG
jgi:predicted HicB family RNase H-like nuclease